MAAQFPLQQCNSSQSLKPQGCPAGDWVLQELGRQLGHAIRAILPGLVQRGAHRAWRAPYKISGRHLQHTAPAALHPQQPHELLAEHHPCRTPLRLTRQRTGQRLSISSLQLHTNSSIHNGCSLVHRLPQCFHMDRKAQNKCHLSILRMVAP